jgi:hypothetical protein
MSNQENSITGFAFYALAAISGLAALIATGMKEVPPGVGFAALMGAASLWWMGKVVSLLKQIAGGGMKPPDARPAESKTERQRKLDEAARRTFGGG